MGVTDAQARRIVQLVSEGWTSGQIADELGLELHAVTYVRAREGIPAAVGRPATGERARCSARVDDDVIAQIDANAARSDTTRSDVVAEVLTAWARGERAPARARK